MKWLKGWGPSPRDEAGRFWEKVRRAGPDECWVWTARCNNRGYGMFYRTRTEFKVRTQPASRVAWELTHGTIDPALDVCHRCDNPPCCNPAHLFLGTPTDNARDMVAKGRARYVTHRGEDHGHSKLTAQQVRDIRANAALCRVTFKELGTRHGVDRSTISLIVRNKTWVSDARA